MQLETEKKKMEALGTSEAQDAKSEAGWNNAMKRASGEKGKDNEEVIKRSIKREQHKKKKSTKEWQARMQMQKKQQEERSRKRTENIQKALQRRKEKGKGKVSLPCIPCHCTYPKKR